MAYMARSPGMETQHMSLRVFALKQEAAEPRPSPFRIPGLYKEQRANTLLKRIVSKLLQYQGSIGVRPIVKRDQESPFARTLTHNALRCSEPDLMTFPVQT